VSGSMTILPFDLRLSRPALASATPAALDPRHPTYPILTDPKLGALQNNGGPTMTGALLSGSPAIDAGNPTGCVDGQGHLLKTDQRGKPRPDKEDTGGCDMGAYESQN